jgi:Fuc2NAc and GlcNAc transferase
MPCVLLQAQPPLQWLACGAAVAVAGWIDDLRGLGKRTRLVAYALAVLLPLAMWLPLRFDGWMWLPLLCACALGWLWLLNLYNFMDGINGIATAQALFALAGVIALGANGTVSAYWYALTIALLAGYMPWNFPRARVFMGDAGSAFLGYWLGGLAWLAAFDDAVNGAIWLILLGVFIVDASWTLATRIITRQQWHAPHRSHLYQVLSRRLQSHTKAVGLQMLFSLLWLLPCAYAVRAQMLAPFAGVLLAYAPLLFACRIYRAGRLAE